MMDVQDTGDSGDGLTAFGYAANTTTATIGANADVVFGLDANAFPNVGFTTLPNASAPFVVATTGVYQFDFSIAGVPGAGTSLEFAIYVNGVAPPLGTGFEFRSNFSPTLGDVLLVVGHGLIQLSAADVVTLRNRTLAGLGTVDVTQSPPGGEVGVNAMLTLALIQAN